MTGWLAGAAALIAAPALAGLVVLVLAGALPSGDAAVGALLALLAAAALAWWLERRLLRFQAAVRALADDEDGTAVRTPFPLAGLGRAVAALARDLRRRQADEARRVAEAEAVLAGLTEPVILVDRARRIVLANAAARALLGDPGRERDLAAAIRHPGILAAADAVLAGAPARLVDFDLAVPVERHFRARVAAAAYAGARAAILVLHDVTELQRSHRMRADFVANASHELRTPLASLIGFIETLRGPAREDEEARARFLAIMDGEARRMARLLDDLLSLSRIELNEHVSPNDAVDVAAVLRAVAAAFEVRAAARDMRIVVETPPALPPVLGERDELSQVFQNLIDNAVKYGRPGTPVRIAARLEAGGAEGDRVAVSVRDEGEGVPREEIPRLTERFYRARSARAPAPGGTGLGLAIVKHILLRHRGALAIDSDIGRGTVVTVRLRPVIKP